jgi:hypothetical protein
VVIDRTTSLFIHGADRMATMLVARDPSQPLFVVRSAPLVNFAGVRLYPTRQTVSPPLNAKAITITSTAPVSLEFQDCFIDSATLEFTGPGTYRVQSCAFDPRGRARTGVLVDHPGADVLIFGGDISNGQDRLLSDAYAHVWQKRGQLRVYATTVEAGLGPADFRIETASALGPHVIASVRSEGVNGALNHVGVSRMLYTPPTSDKVDVVLKNNGGAWITGPQTSNPQDRTNCKLAWYNGAGTLWLLGNRGEICIRHLAEGNAPQAEIVSVGNFIGSPAPFSIVARRVVTALDEFSNYNWTGVQTPPWTRWIPDGSNPPKLSSYLGVPVPPHDELPPSLERPTMTATLPGMINVKAAPYGARGDGLTDDTAAIQRALDANCDTSTPKLIHFPAGTYRISNTLYLNHRSGGACRGVYPYGGWLAGAGSGQTRLEMAPGVKKGVFATDGLGYATVQGITFKTWTWQAGDPQEPNFDLDFYAGPGFVATQQNNFYDVVFDGGYAAFATGVRPPTAHQCNSNAIFRSKFQNAGIGFVSGHYNALANLVYDAEFANNDYAMGSWTTDGTKMAQGGTFYAYRVIARGTRKQDFLIRGSATGSTWHFYGWNSDAPAYVAGVEATSVGYPILFEGATLAPRPGVEHPFDIASGQGPFFLYSQLTRAGIRIGWANPAQGYAVKMASEINDWLSSSAGSFGQLDAISTTVPASLGAPGQPVLVQ